MPRLTKRPAVPLLTILTPCFNEEENVREVYRQVKAAMETVPDCDYEHLFIDNASKDRTVDILREIAAADKRVKVVASSSQRVALTDSMTRIAQTLPTPASARRAITMWAGTIIAKALPTRPTSGQVGLLELSTAMQYRARRTATAPRP